MKEKHIKISFVFMFVLILVFAGVFTYFNVLKYGSVMKINLPVLTFSLILPIYYGFKQKIYKLKVSIFLYSVFVLVVFMFLLSVPEYTYDEAVENLKSEVSGEYVSLPIKHTKETSFFYAGKYRIQLGEVIYSYELSNHSYKVIDRSK